MLLLPFFLLFNLLQKIQVFRSCRFFLSTEIATTSLYKLRPELLSFFFAGPISQITIRLTVLLCLVTTLVPRMSTSVHWF